MLALARLGLALLLAAAPAGAQKPSHPFLGIFDGEGMRLVLGAAGAAYDGTLSVGALSFAVIAQHAGEGLAGSYAVATGRVAFTATLQGDTLVLRRGNSETRLRRFQLAPLRPPEPRKFPALASLGPARIAPARAWTVLVYVAADNDLEGAALLDLQEMLRGVPAGTVDVIALVDRAKEYATTTPDWTDARVLHVARPRADAPAQLAALATPGELDMGDPEVLACFVEGAARAFPAPRTALVLWDHGGGWSQQCLDFDRGGAAGIDGLSLVEVRDGIEKGLARAGARPLDILGFDQCLMAQLETALECAGVARILVASQAVEPGAGWPWDTVLPLFTADVANDDIARQMVKAYADSYAGKDDATTLAAFDLARAIVLRERLDALARALEPHLDVAWPHVARALFYAESYAGRDDFRTRQQATMSVDLLDALARIRHGMRPFPAESEFTAFVDAHRNLVLASSVGPRRWLSRGVSVYAPPSAAQMDPAWRQTELGKTSAWARLLDALHARVAKNARAPRFEGVRATDERGTAKATVAALAGDQLVATLRGDNVVWTHLEDARGTPDDAIVTRRGFVLDSQWITRLGGAAADDVDLMMPVYQDGRTEFRTELQGMRFLVADQDLRGTASVYFDSPAPDAPIRVMADYQSPAHAGFQEVEVLFDPASWLATGLIARVTLPDGRVLRRGVEPHAQGTLWLAHETRKNGLVGRQRGMTLTWGQGLRLVLDEDTFGDHVVTLRAETMAGQAGEARVAYRAVPSEVLKQWRASWRAFRPEQLVGTWDQHYLGPGGAPVAMGVALTITAAGPGRYVAEATFRGPQGEQRVKYVWHLDPASGTLRIVTDTPGSRTNAYYGPAVWLGDEGLRAKMLNFGGVFWGWRRR